MILAYVSLDKGLDIGTLNSAGKYQFVNYSQYLASSSGIRATFDKFGNVGYVSNNPGFDLGIKQSDGAYKFEHFGQKQGLDNYNGADIAFNNNGDIAFGSFKGGIYIAKRTKNGEYKKFKHYFSGNTRGIINDETNNLAFDSKGDLAYTSPNSLSIGFYKWGRYHFVSYDSQINDFTFGVTFDKNNNVYVATDENGLFIGTRNKNKYTFKDYANHYFSGTSVAVDNNNNIAVASLQIGYSPDRHQHIGLNVGKIVDNQYKFSTYNRKQGVKVSWGNWVTFSNAGVLVYVSADCGLFIGKV